MFDIPPLDRALEAPLQKLLDEKAKPVGSLGRLETLAIQIGLIRGALKPELGSARCTVFAGDHGLTEEGVSSHPPEVTAAMVQNFLHGGATISAYSRIAKADLNVVDAGVKFPVDPGPGFVDAKIAPGTANAAREPAMTSEQCDAAIAKGAALAREAIAESADILAPGEMGIGNTASASLIVHRLAPAPLEAVIGRGAGLDDAGLGRKHAALAKAAARSDATRPARRDARVRRLRDRDDDRLHARRRCREPHRHRRRFHCRSRRAHRLPHRPCRPRAHGLRAPLARSRGRKRSSMRWRPTRCSISECASAKAPARRWPIPLVRAAAAILTDLADYPR